MAMKSQKIRNDLWRITAPDGQHADLLMLGDGRWQVMFTGGGIHAKRFDAKVEAEQLLAK